MLKDEKPFAVFSFLLGRTLWCLVVQLFLVWVQGKVIMAAGAERFRRARGVFLPALHSASHLSHSHFTCR